MDIGQGAFVGMTILPAGSEEEIQTSQQNIDTDFSMDTALVLVTKKVSSILSAALLDIIHYCCDHLDCDLLAGNGKESSDPTNPNQQNENRQRHKDN